MRQPEPPYRQRPIPSFLSVVIDTVQKKTERTAFIGIMTYPDTPRPLKPLLEQ